MRSLTASLHELLPLGVVLGVTALVLWGLPQAHQAHSPAFRRRRILNWMSLGLTYAFMYMGRYNLTVAKSALGERMSNGHFGNIFFWGTLTYGCAFVLNGPLADRWGGRRIILIAAAGGALVNAIMGLITWEVLHGVLPESSLVPLFSVLYAVNMYFQSFGAVAIMKINASWFHLRERGVFGGIFGLIIAVGVYLAFDWGRLVAENLPLEWLFYMPALVLCFFLVLDWAVVRDLPSHAGHVDFDPADASSLDEGPPLTMAKMAGRMLRNPVILTMGCIEFCSGFLRNAVMHWYVIFAHQTGLNASFVTRHWGMLLCAAGICAGVGAGAISDHLFEARRGPAALLLYGVLTTCAVVALCTLQTAVLGWMAVVISACVIGVHGLLSGTASMDFGGRKNVGMAVGLIDGLVYLGTATQALVFGIVLPDGEAAADAGNWWPWPLVMLGVAFVGLLLTTRLWHARPVSLNPAQPEPPVWVPSSDGEEEGGAREGREVPQADGPADSVRPPSER